MRTAGGVPAGVWRQTGGLADWRWVVCGSVSTHIHGKHVKPSGFHTQPIGVMSQISCPEDRGALGIQKGRRDREDRSAFAVTQCA